MSTETNTAPEVKPAKTKVIFKDIGRDRRSWTKDFPRDPSLEAIAKEAKRSGGLLSRDIEAVVDDDGRTGAIFASFRPVGVFVILKETAAHV